MSVVVAGVGPALGRALCRAFRDEGHRVGALARSQVDIDGVVGERCDLTDGAQVRRAIAALESRHGPTRVLVHNVGVLVRGPFLELTAADFEQALRVGVLAAVHTTQCVLPGMLAAGGGTILVTGATAATRGARGFAPFAAAKAAQRTLAQSLAREFGAQGVHVAHVVLDGLIWSEQTRDRAGVGPEGCLLPDDVARTYVELHRQPRSAWTHELDLRPFEESF